MDEFALVLIVIITIAFLLKDKRYRWIYIIAKTYKRDIRVFVILYKAGKWAKKYIKGQCTLASEVALVAKRYPKKTALRCEDEAWTYEMVVRFQNKIARLFVQEGYKKGDTVALLLDNCVEYTCVWLGLSQVGIVTALINTNLAKTSLVHSLTIVNATGIIFGSNFASTIKDIAPSLKSMKLYEYQANAKISGILKNGNNLKALLETVSDEDLGDEYVRGGTNDPLIYMYTSGTTGLPKAAVITNIRCLVLLRRYMLTIGLTDKYVTYSPLPLYHMTGGLYAATQTLLRGSTAVIAKKFSATSYFKDCQKYNCNAATYVGEMCRYLLALPEDTPIGHNLLSLHGVGLRPQLWSKFVERFKIKNILEAYSSTEGNISLVNIDSAPGAVGFIPRYMLKYSPAKLIKCDETTGEPLRNRRGFCMACGVDEPGLFVGKVDSSNVTLTFHGYTDEEATSKKLLTNVFIEGDVYYNSGDILVYDELGYFYMKDRTGDTYRWKGENVSAAEVESIVSKVVQLADVAVYGVKIPETEGTAGMAAIQDRDKNIDFDSLATKLAPHLPKYAMPIFIRATSSLAMTSTYRLRKVELKEEGYDINKVKDTIYFYDTSLRKYVVLSKELYGKIKSGQIKF